jgi:hypothetical protein
MPQLWSGTSTKQFGDLSLLVTAGLTRADYDVITWHWYMRPKPDYPTQLNRQEQEFRTRLSDPVSPIFATESGLFTAPNYTGPANSVTEAEQATGLGLLCDEYARRGWGLSIFELLDDPDPGGAEREAHFGLIRVQTINPSTWSRKPSFPVVRTKTRTAA